MSPIAWAESDIGGRDRDVGTKSKLNRNICSITAVQTVPGTISRSKNSNIGFSIPIVLGRNRNIVG